MSTYSPPVALKWNRYACDALYLTNTPPTIGSRMLAMMHTAMYDAMVIYLSPKEMPTSPELQKFKETPCDYNAENRQEAYSYAAYRVLENDALYASPLPESFKADLKNYFKELCYDPDNCSEDMKLPSGIGNLAARLVMESRMGDGSNQKNGYKDYTNYEPVNAPPPELPKQLDHWQPQIRKNKPETFLTPHWGKVSPFALESGDQCRPEPPIGECEKGFKEQGDYITKVSADLTEAQKMRSEVWAGRHEDRFDGLPTQDDYKNWVAPPPQMCRIIRDIIEDREIHGVPAVVLFFVVTNAIMDACIATWDCKRHYDYVLPITLIQRLRDNELFKSWGGPGRGTVEMQGEGWRCYDCSELPSAEYVSGQSTFSSAMAEVVKCFFDGDGSYGREICIPAGGSKIEGECEPALPLKEIVLSWKTVDDVAADAGKSGIYGGIHFKDGDMNGRKLGKEVAIIVWEKACRLLNGEKT